MAHKKNKWPGKTGKSISWEQFEKWKEQGKKLEPNVVFDPVFGRPDPFRGKYDKKKASKRYTVKEILLISLVQFQKVYKNTFHSFLNLSKCLNIESILRG